MIESLFDAVNYYWLGGSNFITMWGFSDIFFWIH